MTFDFTSFFDGGSDVAVPTATVLMMLLETCRLCPPARQLRRTPADGFGIGEQAQNNMDYLALGDAASCQKLKGWACG